MQLKQKSGYRTVISLLVVLTTLLLNCSSSGKEETSNSPEESTTLSRPDTIKTEISIEGTAETMQMYLLESPDHFPLTFSTYVPDDMEIEHLQLDGTVAIRILAAFGDHLNQEAHLTIGTFASDVTAREARESAKEKTRSLGPITEDSARYSWAQTAYSFKGDRVGFVALAQKNNQWFYLLASYPPEYGDGMGPRIHQIVQQWRWQNNSKPLEGLIK